LVGVWRRQGQLPMPAAGAFGSKPPGHRQRQRSFDQPRQASARSMSAAGTRAVTSFGGSAQGRWPLRGAHRASKLPPPPTATAA